MIFEGKKSLETQSKIPIANIKSRISKLLTLAINFPDEGESRKEKLKTLNQKMEKSGENKENFMVDEDEDVPSKTERPIFKIENEGFQIRRNSINFNKRRSVFDEKKIERFSYQTKNFRDSMEKMTYQENEYSVFKQKMISKTNSKYSISDKKIDWNFSSQKKKFQTYKKYEILNRKCENTKKKSVNKKSKEKIQKKKSEISKENLSKIQKLKKDFKKRISRLKLKPSITQKEPEFEDDKKKEIEIKTDLAQKFKT